MWRGPGRTPRRANVWRGRYAGIAPTPYSQMSQIRLHPDWGTNERDGVSRTAWERARERDSKSGREQVRACDTNREGRTNPAREVTFSNRTACPPRRRPPAAHLPPKNVLETCSSSTYPRRTQPGSAVPANGGSSRQSSRQSRPSRRGASYAPDAADFSTCSPPHA